VARKDRAFFRKTVFMSNDLSRSSALAPARTGDRGGAEGGEEEPDAITIGVGSFAAARTCDDATRPHATKPHLTVEWSLPVLPDALLWPTAYQYVTFDEGPKKRARYANALVVDSRREYSERTQSTVLKGTLITPGDDATGDDGLSPYEFQAQYLMQRPEPLGADKRLLLVDRAKGVATYTDPLQKKVEFRVVNAKPAVVDRYRVEHRSLTAAEARARRELAARVVGAADLSEGEEGGGEAPGHSDDDSGLSDA
jgi:hypothetical protein